jgi:hypothetical protein
MEQRIENGGWRIAREREREFFDNAFLSKSRSEKSQFKPMLLAAWVSSVLELFSRLDRWMIYSVHASAAGLLHADAECEISTL